MVVGVNAVTGVRIGGGVRVWCAGRPPPSAHVCITWRSHCPSSLGSVTFSN